VFLTLLSLFLVKKKKNYWAALCLGLGGAFKMFPLFFLPFLALSEGKSWASKIKILLVGLLPYLLSIAPFVGSGVFRQTVLFSNQSQKMLFAKIMVSGAEYLSWFVVFYVFLLALSFKQKKDLWSWFLAVLLVFFSFTHYHPQWFLWITPFLVFFIVERPKYKILTLGLFFCWLTITLLFEPSLSLGLFSPISPSLIKAPDLSEALNHFYPVFEFKSLVRSIFAGLSAVIAFLILRRDETI
ncbi:MAG: glycosyltransferase 87 family protein, partial [Patescibacteria group bacterium]|nr:glycosyltransferase 87 family protein [Patescibacteria group bacterium]